MEGVLYRLAKFCSKFLRDFVKANGYDFVNANVFKLCLLSLLDVELFSLGFYSYYVLLLVFEANFNDNVGCKYESDSLNYIENYNYNF